MRLKPQRTPPPVILENSSSCFLMIIKHTSRCWEGNLSSHSLLCSPAANKSTGMRQRNPENHDKTVLPASLLHGNYKQSYIFYIVKHMEMIFIVALMCYFKQSVSLFPSWCFNQCSLRETAIHHHNGCRDAVNVKCRI